MSNDIADLDLLPETDPIAATDLVDQGLLPCRGITCGGETCIFTCFITEW